MKILQINNQHYPKGGAQVVYFNTAHLLREKGHEVFFFAQKDNESLTDDFSEYFPPSEDIRQLSVLLKFKSVISFIYNKQASRKLEEYIKLIKPDIAHVHLFMGGITTGALRVLKKHNIPVIHTVHDYRLICPAYLYLDGKSKVCEKCKKSKYYNCILNKCSESKLSQSAVLSLDAYYRKFFLKPQSFIDKYLFVSDFAMNKHIEYDYDCVSKMKRIYNFFPGIEKIKPNTSKGNYILFLGRLSREKGIETLMRAIQKMECSIKIAGTGPLYDSLLQNTPKQVSFLGFQSGNNLTNLIQNASFIIVPSEWYENNPMSIIESYAFGKPVIGADIGGILEIIIDNKTGFLFKSGNIDSLKKTIEKANLLSQKEYERMSLNARNFALKFFNPQKHYKELIELYEQLINSKKGNNEK